MPFEDRITALRQAVRANVPSGAQARRRVAATASTALFLLVLLASVGLFRFVLLGIAATICGACIAGAVVVVARHARSLRGLAPRARGLGRGVRPVVTHAAERSRRAVGVSLQHARRTSDRVVAAAGPRIAGAGPRLAAAGAVAQRSARAAAARAGEHASAAWPTRTATVRHQEALRANVAGLRLRREGEYAEAAEQHRIALALFRDLGDRRSEALTLNNLALALDRAGDGRALDLFEEAATILGELGEEQHEGEVIANLAVAFRRRGSAERSAEVLELALGKLRPDSAAYRKVEGLRRAS